MKIKKSVLDYVTDVLCVLLLVGITLFLLFIWERIPVTLPMHQDLFGNIDRYGSKAELYSILAIDWIMYAGITVLTAFPSAWNTGVTVTKANEEKVYRTLKNMISLLKLLVVFNFTYMIFVMCMNLVMPVWYLPMFLIAVFGTIIVSIIKLIKIKKED